VTDKQAWLAVFGTIFLTLCGQLLIKWRVASIVLPSGPIEKIGALLWLLTDLWILAAIGSAFLAALLWMSAMTRLPLSIAYPFTSLSIVMVALFGALFMQEPITPAKAGGVLLVGLGLLVLARG
jgi:drug/metabolite transporter (DMT)-like permease